MGEATHFSDVTVDGNLKVTGSGGQAIETYDFFSAGVQTTGTRKSERLIGVGGATIIDVRAYLETAPVGSSFIVDVNKNGISIFTTQANRPTVLAAANASSTTPPDVLSLSGGDRLSFDVDQIGSGTAGSDLTVSVTIKRMIV